eukprot:scaffold103389_cov22-Tisochrysis_lutea.AAC.3
MSSQNDICTSGTPGLQNDHYNSTLLICRNSCNTQKKKLSTSIPRVLIMTKEPILKGVTQGARAGCSQTGTARLAHLGPMRSPVSAQVQADVVKEDCCQTGLISYRYYTPGTPRPHAFPGVCNKCKRM